MCGTDILDDAQNRAAFVADVTHQRDRSAANPPTLVHDHVAKNCSRSTVDVSINVEVAANHHHRAGRRRAGGNDEVTRCHLRVSSPSRESDVVALLSVRILRGRGRHH